MDILVLTKTSGILKPFGIVLGYIMDFIYRFLMLLGINNVGLSIILLTLVINILLIPLTIRQQKFTKMSSIMNPELQKIQKKYNGKRDDRSMRMMQAETKAVYDKYGASPSGGCLPVLIQFPILIVLYRVIQNVPAYVTPIREVYEKIASPIMNADPDGSIMAGLMKKLSITVSKFDIGDINKVIDSLYMVKSGSWGAVRDAFASSPDVVNAVNNVSGTIIGMNRLPFGLSITDTPITFGNGAAGIFPGIMIPILAGLTQFISIRVSNKISGAASAASQQNSGMMKSMNIMMPLISVYFTARLQAGMGIYWIASAVFRTIILVIIDKFFNKINVDEIIEKNKEKAAKKAAKRAANEEKFSQYASMSTKSISDIAGKSVSKANASENVQKSQTPKTEPAPADPAKKGGKSSGGKKRNGDNSSISNYAHMVKRNKE